MDGLENDIKNLCRGIDLAVLNFLIHKGLESIKKNDTLVSLEYSEIESIYKNND